MRTRVSQNVVSVIPVQGGCRGTHFVIPAQAGIQSNQRWIPVGTGKTSVVQQPMRIGAVVAAVVVVVFLCGVVLAPWVRLLLYENNLPLGTILQSSYFQRVIAWTMAQAAVSTAIAALLGVWVGYCCYAHEGRITRTVLRLTLLPFVLPTLVAAQGVLGVFGWWQSPWLLVLGNVFFNAGLFVVVTHKSLLALGQPLVQIAAVLGCNHWRCLWRVQLPLIRNALLACMTQVFVLCLGNFGLALLLAGFAHPTIEVAIFSAVNHSFDIATANALAVAMLALCGVVMVGFVYVNKGFTIDISGYSPNHDSTLWRTPWFNMALALYALVCLAPLAMALLAPLLQFDASRTLAAAKVLVDANTWFALSNTLMLSGYAVLGSILIGSCHALAAAVFPVFKGLFFLPWMVSPLVLGLGLLLVYPQWVASDVVIVAAYVLLAYPLLAHTLANAIAEFPVGLYLTARTLGASLPRSLIRVVVPCLMPAVWRGVGFAGATAIGEFAISLFLSRPQWLTLSTLIYQKLGRPGQLLEAQWLCVLLAVVVALWWGGCNTMARYSRHA